MGARLGRCCHAVCTYTRTRNAKPREFLDYPIFLYRVNKTKAKRVAQAVKWIAGGKQRNWRYQ